MRDGGRGGWQKASTTSFSSITSANVRISPQKVLTFGFKSFTTLVQNSKFVNSASPKLLNLNQDYLLKKAVSPIKSL